MNALGNCQHCGEMRPCECAASDNAASAEKRDDIRRSIIRQLGDDPHADRIILLSTDWDIVLEALSGDIA